MIIKLIKAILNQKKGEREQVKPIEVTVHEVQLTDPEVIQWAHRMYDNFNGNGQN